MDWQKIFYAIEIPVERRQRFRDLIKQRFHCDTWGTQDGRVIPVILMRDSHLDNAWQFIYNRAIEAYKADNDKEFDRRYAAVDLLHRELLRRGDDAHGMQFNTLEEIFMDQDYDDYDDGIGPLDHYQAMRYYTGKE